MTPSIRRGSVHSWLSRHCKKTGVCEHCQSRGRTEWAFLRHGDLYTRNRQDYIELCHGCHARFDARTTNEMNEVQERFSAALRSGYQPT